MCFSATVSFSASAMLLPLGALSLWRAYRLDKRLLFFAAIPLIFGLHQLIEGLLWLFLQDSPPRAPHALILLYTFIAFFLWPIYIPWSLSCFEPEVHHKRRLQGLAIIGFVTSAMVYGAMLLGVVVVQAEVVQHSIAYPSSLSLWHAYLFTIIYVLIVVSACFISDSRWVNGFGIFLFLSFFISVFLYFYTFASVWCFFAAILSLYIVWTIPRIAQSLREHG